MKISVSKLEKALSNAGVDYNDLKNGRKSSKGSTAVSTGSTSNIISTKVVGVRKAVATKA